ncbi:uncharacterized protein BCR38DRAFT_450275 [Pseudomassariella vexata]|uniref:Uncharacterized protein n=1 Tax=Pseudomassariella vexata TaxID=1141098 RepID=A0A1Y2DC92_9PEZI|nr:uncharacterized protein BCR38DRAFT_450275 [Pseudomassariella vexata]ORY56878.1 hypothetical protein BCR38DRAFT_450275 [Pseudomassariella vexata]
MIISYIFLAASLSDMCLKAKAAEVVNGYFGFEVPGIMAGLAGSQIRFVLPGGNKVEGWTLQLPGLLNHTNVTRTTPGLYILDPSFSLTSQLFISYSSYHA